MEVEKEFNQNADSRDSSNSSSSQGENTPSPSASSPKPKPANRERREKRTAFNKSQASNNGPSSRSGRSSRAAVPTSPEDEEADVGSVHLLRSEIPTSLRTRSAAGNAFTALRLNDEQCLSLDANGGAQIVPTSTVPSSQIADASESMDLSNDPRGRKILRILRHTQTPAMPSAVDTTDILDDSNQSEVCFILSICVGVSQNY